MTDRPNYHGDGDYTMRLDYDMRRTPALHEPAFEGLEELLGYHEEITRHSYVDGAARRELSVVGIENEPAEQIVFSDLTRVEVQRLPVQTEIDVVVAEYRRGLLRQMAQLTVRQYIADSAPFINEYHFEVFAGGGRQATVSSTDVVRGQGLDSRPMTPYDYHQLVEHIDHAAEMTATVGVMADLKGVNDER